jgi:hypothetical protein
LFEMTNHPVCAAKERDLLIEAQPPLLENGGEWGWRHSLPTSATYFGQLCAHFVN